LEATVSARLFALLAALAASPVVFAEFLAWVDRTRNWFGGMERYQ
jgi:hypothetical protein